MQINKVSKKHFLLLVIVILFTSLACLSQAVLPTSTPAPTNTPGPTNTPKATESPLKNASGEVPTEAALHVEIGNELTYDTNPPSSGMHFGQTMVTGFFDNEDINVINLEDPAGYILHSLEHGYVTIWYNCNGIDSEACQTLKDNLRVIVEADPSKVIVYPWLDMNEPIVLVSWGNILRLDSFDADLIAEFIIENRSHPRAPEPNVP